MTSLAKSSQAVQLGGRAPVYTICALGRSGAKSHQPSGPAALAASLATDAGSVTSGGGSGGGGPAVVTLAFTIDPMGTIVKHVAMRAGTIHGEPEPVRELVGAMLAVFRQQEVQELWRDHVQRHGSGMHSASEPLLPSAILLLRSWTKEADFYDKTEFDFGPFTHPNREGSEVAQLTSALRAAYLDGRDGNSSSSSCSSSGGYGDPAAEALALPLTFYTVYDRDPDLRLFWQPGCGEDDTGGRYRQQRSDQVGQTRNLPAGEYYHCFL